MKAAQFALHAQMEERHWWFLGRRKIVTELIHRTVPPSTGKAIVDIGCGTGGNIASLVNDYTCIGMDPSEEAVRRARERFRQVPFVCGSQPMDLGETVLKTDLLLLMDVLEHVDDDFWFFSEWFSKIPAASYVLLTVPADPKLWSKHDVAFGHFRRYDRRRLEQLWEGLPVTVNLLSYYNALLYPLIRGVRTLNRWRGTSFGENGTDFKTPPGIFNGLLTQIFGAETRVLIDTLEGKRSDGFQRGVSLIALLRREAGTILPRRKPAHVDG